MPPSPQPAAVADGKTCPLCGRPIPRSMESRHHLVPKVKGGAKGECVILHPVCHSKIHSVFTEAELARNFSTIEKLLAHEQIATFVKWIGKRPPEFRARNPSKRRKLRKR